MYLRHRRRCVLGVRQPSKAAPLIAAMCSDRSAPDSLPQSHRGLSDDPGQPESSPGYRRSVACIAGLLGRSDVELDDLADEDQCFSQQRLSLAVTEADRSRELADVAHVYGHPGCVRPRRRAPHLSGDAAFSDAHLAAALHLRLALPRPCLGA